MATVCLDTSTWLEYLNDGPHGPRIRALVDSSPRVVTPAPVAAELIEAARRRKLNSKLFLRFLRSRSDVVALNAEVARLAGRINAEKADVEGWTMMESFVLATARYTRSRLYTRDPLFAEVKGAVVLQLSRGAARGASASGTTGPA
jgi:predicted nucleic acid-binding protein